MSAAQLGSPQTEKILSRKEDGIGWLTINQPERRNAVSLAMWDAIARICTDFATDPSVRVVVLHGAGDRAFASGADISEFEKVRADAAAEAAYRARTAQAGNSLLTLGKPLIAMIRGYCVGGGLAIALKADIRVASDDSHFAIPAAKLGLAYSRSGLAPLVHLVGPAIAKEMLMTGRLFTAKEAYEARLINRVVSPEMLVKETTELARQIAENAPLTVHAAKVTIDDLSRAAQAADPAALEALYQSCFDSEDFAEGRRAFMEKRKPGFVGR
ncbi:enoyl-CoA hydratase [Acidisphaera sp. L21]|uniref:enoyl-CoA hydratase n=1 Tax=Acidisphaera sp. L21 TaxID=1641851 RepID=UPI00131BBA3C|nr:enoyl-CoA hydratase [Acidisphaera sp. L21]